MAPRSRTIDLKSPQPLPFRTDPAYLVFTSGESLSAFYGLDPDAREREWSFRVDWTREILLVVERGECPSGGYRIAIENLAYDQPDHPAGTLLARVALSDPGPDDFVTMMLTHPRAAVAVSRAGLGSLSRVVFAGLRGDILRTVEVTR